MIILEPCAGLGNRILAMATAYNIATEYEQKMIVFWDLDGAVGIPLERLFELPKSIKVITTTKLPYKKRFFLRCKSEMFRFLSKTFMEQFLDCCDIEELKHKNKHLIREQFQKNIYVKSFCELEDIKDKHIFNIFLPSLEILNYGETVFKQINENTIGFHIRRTDHEDAIKRSPMHLFVKKIEDHLQSNDVALFFLATDDAKVEEELRKKFGARMIYNTNKRFSRSDEKGMKDGLVDLLALSKCISIYGSYGSTFSRMASYLGNIELTIVEI